MADQMFKHCCKSRFPFTVPCSVLETITTPRCFLVWAFLTEQQFRSQYGPYRLHKEDFNSLNGESWLTDAMSGPYSCIVRYVYKIKTRENKISTKSCDIDVTFLYSSCGRHWISYHKSHTSFFIIFQVIDCFIYGQRNNVLHVCTHTMTFISEGSVTETLTKVRSYVFFNLGISKHLYCFFQVNFE